MESEFYIPQDPSHIKSVHSIWQTTGFTGFRKERIIPKGVIELIFNFSEEKISASIGSNLVTLPYAFVNGFNRSPIDILLPSRQTFFGVRFHPFAIKKLFKVPAALFSDQLINIETVAPSFHSLIYQVEEQTTFEDRVKMITRWIAGQGMDWSPREVSLNSFLNNEHLPENSISSLASEMCYSPRQLSRKFLEVTGMNSEEILLFKKYQHAVHLMHYSDLSLTQISYQSCFSDQSHFIKSFKTFAQITPTEYRTQKGFVKGHIYADKGD